MDLYACRHCKAKDAELKQDLKYKGHRVCFVYYIQCGHCGSRTRDYPEAPLAAEAWNKACGEKKKTARGTTRTAVRK